MLVALKRSMNVANWRCSIYRYALVIFLALGVLLCRAPSRAYAGGVHFGFGVDVPLPDCIVTPCIPPPAEVYTPPVVVEHAAPPPRVVVEQAPPARVVIEQPPPRVVVEPAAPRVVYEAPPVVVERRSRETTYYRPAPRFHEYHEESERDYYEHRTSYRADEREY